MAAMLRLLSAVIVVGSIATGVPIGSLAPESEHATNHHRRGVVSGHLRLRAERRRADATTFNLYNIAANPLAQAPGVSDNITTNATGETEITYIPEMNIVAAKLTYDKMTSPVIGYHIHAGNSETNGPVIVNFCSESPLPDSLTEGSVPCIQQSNGTAQWYLGQIWDPSTPASVEKQLVEDTANTYVNVHTISAPGGLIRQQDRTMGTIQLAKASKTRKNKLYMYDMVAKPLEELPQVTNISSNATGSVMLTFIPTTGLILADVKYRGISDPVVGMHLHMGDDQVNGPPVVVFCGDSPLPDVLVNWTVPCVQQKPGQIVTYIGNYVQGVDPASVRKALLNNPEDTYFNIHDVISWDLVGANGLIRQQVSNNGGYKIDQA